MASDSPIARFIQAAVASLEDGSFVRLLLSKPAAGRGLPDRVLGRCIELGGSFRLSLTWRHPTCDRVENLGLDEASRWLGGQLQGDYQSALLGTTRRDWQLSMRPGKAPRLTPHPPAATRPPDRSHDQAGHDPLGKDARDWLEALGILDSQGRVRASMADKHRQLNRYADVLTHLVRDVGWGAGAPVTVADMGSGKAYLTFAAWHLLRRRKGWPARVIGIEARQDLADFAAAAARRLGAEGLEFRCGTIAEADLPPLDGLVALHACDTATDDAILRGIALGARLIVVAPCCQKELRPQLEAPPLLESLLRHGLFQERLAEWLTDGLRALYLEWAGYEVRAIEFVAAGHTPKNLMLAAVRRHPAFTREAVRRQLTALKSWFGLRHLALDPLLDRPGSAGSAHAP